MTDEEMLNGCMTNSEHAQKFLFNKYSRIMTGVCLRYADSYEEAQDIVQDGFIKVFKKIGMFSGKGSLEGWVRRIMVNTSLDYLRSIKNERFNVTIDNVSYKLKEDQKVESDLQAEDLLKMVQSLPTGYRTVFNMYAIEGFTHKEIGNALEISENTSKSQYSRARTLLQKKLEEINYKR
ncbi:MAG: RNA polymerase sigma factor [Flavobacteriales bacterium]|nr:RNA polymerase sigma factor [Flavobacteriales bacterium]